MAPYTPSPIAHAKGSVKQLPRFPNFRITVTKEMIESSKVRDSSHCMTSQAIQAAVPSATSVAVDIQTIRLSLPAWRVRGIFLTPRSVQMKIIEFDQGREVEAFSFILRGAHVIPMYKAPRKDLTGIAADQATGAVKPKTVSVARRAALDKANYVRQGLVSTGASDKKGYVPQRVGGKAPPSTPFARRRAFGLRGLER